VPLPLRDDEALLVAGSENWNPADRQLGRDRIRSLQAVTADGDEHLAQFEHLGAHGIRDVALSGADTAVVTTGYELYELDLRTGRLVEWPLDGTSDLHELWVAGESVLVANTAYDEVVELREGRVVERHPVAGFRHAGSRPIAHGRPLGGLVPIGPKPVRDDHFHLNQAIVADDGSMLAVVHHVSGFRPVAELRHRLTRHGDGGVLDLAAGRPYPLGLRAPHSLRRLPSGGWVVLDSGRAEAVVLDDGWSEVRRFPTSGWGRGLAVADDGRLFVGLSATRARYLQPGEEAGGNWVVAFSPAGAELGRWAVPDVEQVWTVRLLRRGDLDRFRSCSAEVVPT
jgi:hypothetical protein